MMKAVLKKKQKDFIDEARRTEAVSQHLCVPEEPLHSSERQAEDGKTEDHNQNNTKRISFRKEFLKLLQTKEGTVLVQNPDRKIDATIPVNVGTPIAVANERPDIWMCVEPNCSTFTTSSAALKIHIQKHHKETLITIFGEDKDWSRKPEICMYCSAVQPLAVDDIKKCTACQRSHLYAQPVNTFYCIPCAMDERRLEAYNEKTKKTEVVKGGPYVVKTFNSKARLLDYLQSQHDVKNWGCPVCDGDCTSESSTRACKLKCIEQALATGTNPDSTNLFGESDNVWHCKQCPEKPSFRTYRDKQKHFLTNHPEKLFRCAMPSLRLTADELRLVAKHENQEAELAKKTGAKDVPGRQEFRPTFSSDEAEEKGDVSTAAPKGRGKRRGAAGSKSGGKSGPVKRSKKV